MDGVSPGAGRKSNTPKKEALGGPHMHTTGITTTLRSGLLGDRELLPHSLVGRSRVDRQKADPLPLAEVLVHRDSLTVNSSEL